MKFYALHITPRALNDIDSAVNYYNGESQNLGFRFADELEKNFEKIASHPDAFAIRYKDVGVNLCENFLISSYTQQITKQKVLKY